MEGEHKVAGLTRGVRGKSGQAKEQEMLTNVNARRQSTLPQAIQ